MRNGGFNQDSTGGCVQDPMKTAGGGDGRMAPGVRHQERGSLCVWEPGGELVFGSLVGNDSLIGIEYFTSIAGILKGLLNTLTHLDSGCSWLFLFQAGTNPAEERPSHEGM